VTFHLQANVLSLGFSPRHIRAHLSSVSKNPGDDRVGGLELNRGVLLYDFFGCCARVERRDDRLERDSGALHADDTIIAIDEWNRRWLECVHSSMLAGRRYTRQTSFACSELISSLSSAHAGLFELALVLAPANSGAGSLATAGNVFVSGAPRG
jgi:hypothetical protein